MSDREGFTGGFFAGAVVGGIFGGLLGSILANRKKNESIESLEDKSKFNSSRESQLEGEESIEIARHTLETKIAQLNLAIDDVRQQLGAVNGNSESENEQNYQN